MELIIGQIYVSKLYGFSYRIFRSGGAGFYSGRGCTKETAIPSNHIRRADVRDATLEEVNKFLVLEMQNGMAQKTNQRGS